MSDPRSQPWRTSRESGNPYRQFTAIQDRSIVGGARGFAGDLVRAVREGPVDAVLAEAAVPGILIGAQAVGRPTAALMPNIYPRPTRGLPPMGTGWLPAPDGHLHEGYRAESATHSRSWPPTGCRRRASRD